MALRIRNLLDDVGASLSLTLVCGESGLSRELSLPDINRPGLAFAGFFDYFPAERLQVVGKTEITFWDALDGGTRRERLDQIFKMKPAGFIISNAQVPPSDLVKAAEETGTPLFTTPVPTSTFVTEIIVYLEEKLAPSVIVHGTLVDVFGAGILLLGESGIGKSETALALLDKGHRLCADDVVEIRRTPEKGLIGNGVKELRYHMEIRGIGILDIQSLFGARAVRERKTIEMVITLVSWDENRHYDRTGLENRTYQILDVTLPMHELPVQMGKNLAVLVEVAALNYRLREMGVNSAEMLNQRLMDAMQERTQDAQVPEAGSQPHYRREKN